MKKFLLSLSLISVLLLVGCALTPSENGEEAVDETAAILVTPSSFDFGEIVQSEGIVSTTFDIKNVGDQTLTMNRLSTSCGCTTALMDMSDLDPGETRAMTVTFDPMTHPDQLGMIERVVYLQTSDPTQPEIEIDITGFVIK